MSTIAELTADLDYLSSVEGISPLAVAVARQVIESGTTSDEWACALEQAQGLLGLAPLRIRSGVAPDLPQADA